MNDYLNAAKVALSAPIEDPEDYRGQSLSALACAAISIAASLTSIADALEAMKPRTVEVTLEEFDLAGFAEAIAEAMKNPGVRSVDISAPSVGPLKHPVDDEAGAR